MRQKIRRFGGSVKRSKPLGSSALVVPSPFYGSVDVRDGHLKTQPSMEG